MKNLRNKGKSTIVWILMGLLILGLGGFGVTSFTSSSSSIGAVGKTDITAEEYARALQAELNAYSQRIGQPVSMAQAETFGIPQAVQSQLFTRAALEEQARLIGISVGDMRVAQVIASASAFKGPTGSFDRTAYSSILRNENLTEAKFEEQVRSDEAQQILQRAVTGGVTAPESLVTRQAEWWLQERDFSWYEVTEDTLPVSVNDPDEAALKAWHQANADQFTAPETRKLTYIWLTPEMLSDEVQLDENALREAYDQRIDEFRRPERRLISRLVFSSAADAQAAKARLDAGEGFDTIVAERGITLEDIDLGEVTREDLGAAAEQVFELEQPGIVGPVETSLGPALISVNAILDSVEITFEQAREDLRTEAALDRAVRMIDDRSGEFEDLLAGGATLEDVAGETPMQIAELDWTNNMPPDEGSIAGYESFREAAAQITENDFPSIQRLDDGGIFALRLDQVVPPTLIPFEESRDEVLADWRAEEVHRLLQNRADELKLKASSAPADETAGGVIEWQSETGLPRDGWNVDLPQQVIRQAFDIPTKGEFGVVTAERRVFLLRLDEIHKADMTSEDALSVQELMSENFSTSLKADFFDYYARAAQQSAGTEYHPAVIEAVNTQIR